MRNILYASAVLQDIYEIFCIILDVKKVGIFFG